MPNMKLVILRLAPLWVGMIAGLVLGLIGSSYTGDLGYSMKNGVTLGLAIGVSGEIIMVIANWRRKK